jgi:hypothetical protein
VSIDEPGAHAVAQYLRSLAPVMRQVPDTDCVLDAGDQ